MMNCWAAAVHNYIILGTHVNIFRVIRRRQTGRGNVGNHGKVETNDQLQQSKIIVSRHIAVVWVLNFPAMTSFNDILKW